RYGGIHSSVQSRVRQSAAKGDHAPVERYTNSVTTSSRDVAQRRCARRSREIRLCVTVLCNVVVVTPLAAQTGGSALAVLPGSTRAAGLGGAGAALVGDAGAVFSNPAGIATIRHLA